MILKCKCPHTFQDKLYGVGMRVHNPCNKGQRCTVCSNLKEGVSPQSPAKAKK